MEERHLLWNIPSKIILNYPEYKYIEFITQKQKKPSLIGWLFRFVVRVVMVQSDGGTTSALEYP
jgi:hypothetical protein